MDLYKRRYNEWVRMTRREAGNGAFQSFPGVDPGESLKTRSSSSKAIANGISTNPKQHDLAEKQKQALSTSGGNDHEKTPLEKAREKYAKVNKLQTSQMQSQSQKLAGKGEARNPGSATSKVTPSAR